MNGPTLEELLDLSAALGGFGVLLFCMAVVIRAKSK
jgi:hypothetical protein